MGKQFKIGSLYVNISRQATAPVEKWGCLTYRCNICGRFCESKVTDLGRETPSCPACGSTVRMRAIIHLLSMELFGARLALPDFPVKPEIKGIGLSDWEGYAIPLAHKLNYINSYYHQEPKLDITAIDPTIEGTLDFLISTEVFEHIPPPVSVAFENAYKLLKPDGVFIFTVPYTKEGNTKEHFPELYEYKLVETNRKYTLHNTTIDGRKQVFEDLVFHGGVGDTLEMRIFSESSLQEELARAGFGRVKIYNEPDFEHGIYWSHNWSLPLTARK